MLTDGETSGEQTLPASWRSRPRQKKIHFNVIGVGTEWNQNLIKDLAKLAEGNWYYIDVNDAARRRARLRRGVRDPGRRRLPRTSRCTCGP